MKKATFIKAEFWMTTLKMLCVFPIALFLRRNKRNVWLISERADQARDNSYCFFKFVKEKHPEQKIVYAIDKHAKDYFKIESFEPDVVQYDSWKHYLYFCISKFHISAHDNMCAPRDALVVRYIPSRKSYKNVFLPHGVSYGISEFCLAKYGKFDLFICSGKQEYENLMNNYGYTEDQLAYTGFPRLDEWHDIRVNPKQIVLMPTWRLYLAQNPEIIFKETDYYKTFQSLITNDALVDFLEEKNLKLVFYLHHEMRKYVSCFSTDCKCIEIVDRDDLYDIQELLKSSALLITDYSSVHFDFAYMKKPVIYYQFDKEEFYDKQYEKSSFDHEKHGFGPVVYNEDELVKAIKDAFTTGFTQDDTYHKRMRDFYTLHDRNNCERVYEEIMKLQKS